MVRIYVDASAVLPRLFDEPVSVVTEETFERHQLNGDALVTSRLTVVEASRAIRARRRREGLSAVGPDLALALSGVSEVPLDEAVIELAKSIGPDGLRSLDAIHLATAVTVCADIMFTFDQRLASAAREWGLGVTPG